MNVNDVKLLFTAWRNHHATLNNCIKCTKPLTFEYNFQICCKKFYFKPCKSYLVQNIAVSTPKFSFAPPNLSTKSNQEFIMIPDPIYWQIESTLVYDRILSLRMPPELPELKNCFKQYLNTSLNHGSLAARSEGKNTFFRKIALAKRSELTLRAMIIPAPFLRPNEIVIPKSMDKKLRLFGKWLIVNRMPSLLPENFVGLKVAHLWDNDCFGIPLEIAEVMNADFDGDECNAYVVTSFQAQAECEIILNSKNNIASFTTGLKLSPCHDMLVTYYLHRERINLPVKLPSLRDTFKVLYELYGSKKCFKYINYMRKYYLKATEEDFLFTLSLKDILEVQCEDTFEKFQEKIESIQDNCLLTQIRSGAKGSSFHLYQMVGMVGYQNIELIEPFAKKPFIQSSFWKGLTSNEIIIHSQAGTEAAFSVKDVWRDGYQWVNCMYCLYMYTLNYTGGIDHITNDILELMYYKDLMVPSTFSILLNKHFQ